MTFIFRLIASVLVISAGTGLATEQGAAPPPGNAGVPNHGPGQPQKEKDGELLYNGIRLPKKGPPESMRAVNKPMPVPYLESPPAVVPIQIGRQLFVDDFLIAKTDLKRTFHRPQKFAGNPVIKAETPHELEPQDDLDDRGIAIGVACFLPGGAFYDPTAEHFQFWYTAGHRGSLATATSKDGLTWTRSKIAPDGSNILIPKALNPRNSTIWLDLDADPAKRLKLHTVNGQKLRTSPDGLTWTSGRAAGKAADYSSFFYNPFRQVWAYSIKSENHLGRVRKYAESKVFEEGDWDKAVYWMNADQLDLPDPRIDDPAQLYSHVAVAYESLLLGEFVIHRGPHNKVCTVGKFPKRTDIVLGYSRDGFHWTRPDREAFIPQTDKDGDWDRRYIQAPNGVCFVVGDKLIFPYSAFSGYAPDGTPGMYSGAGIGLAMLRRDGFVSMDASATSGMLETRPLTFEGKYFFVNVDAPQGDMRVEVLDENEQPIPPFILANCEPVKADSTIHRVTWKGAANLSALNGKSVRFRFRLENGKLYAFWVSPNETGASYGYTAGGGPGFKDRIDDKGIQAYPKSSASK